eukprot:scaffold21376_cov33-Prasinocladus_malaysianus.AAC.1
MPLKGDKCRLSTLMVLPYSYEYRYLHNSPFANSATWPSRTQVRVLRMQNAFICEIKRRTCANHFILIATSTLERRDIGTSTTMPIFLEHLLGLMRHICVIYLNACIVC